jgi:hypothetical protein
MLLSMSLGKSRLGFEAGGSFCDLSGGAGRWAVEVSVSAAREGRVDSFCSNASSRRLADNAPAAQVTADSGGPKLCDLCQKSVAQSYRLGWIEPLIALVLCAAAPAGIAGFNESILALPGLTSGCWGADG